MDKIVKLPEPQTDLDFPLMKALENRRTVRKWKELILADPEPFPIKKIILSKDETTSSYLIMDVNDYTTEEVEMSQFFQNLPIGEEVILLVYHQKYYFIPETKVEVT